MKATTTKREVTFCLLCLASAIAGAQELPFPAARPETSSTTTLEPRYGGIDKSEAQPAADELRCRGGDLYFTVVEGRTNTSGEQTSFMTMDFEHAARAAGASGRELQPGQCAFVERALRTDEPYQLIQEVVSFGQTRQQLHGTPVDASPTGAERFPDAQNLPRYLDDTRRYWSFFVRQNAPLPFGRFEASSGRYWKPAHGISDGVTESVMSSHVRHDRVLGPAKP